MSSSATLGQRIQRAREALGLRQEELAKQVGFKSRQILSDLERGTRSVKDSGVRPSAVLDDVLENQLGVLVWYLETGSDSAAACTRGEFGSAILVPRSSAPWRRNFDIAHELFHLLTWEATNQLELESELSRRAEQLANCFAAALLLPAKPLLRDFTERTIDGAIGSADLIGLARDYGVSTDALLWRLLNLGRFAGPDEVRGLLDDLGFRALDRQSKEGRWADAPRLPRRFVVLAYRAVLRGRLSRAVLAEYLGCGLRDLAAELEQYGVLGYSEASEGEQLPSLHGTPDRQERCDDPESSPLCFA